MIISPEFWSIPFVCAVSFHSEWVVEGYLIIPSNSLEVNFEQISEEKLYFLWLKSPDVLVLPFSCFLCADKPLFLDQHFLTRTHIGLSECSALLATPAHNSEVRKKKASNVLSHLKKTPNNIMLSPGFLHGLMLICTFHLSQHYTCRTRDLPCMIPFPWILYFIRYVLHVWSLQSTLQTFNPISVT